MVFSILSVDSSPEIIRPTLHLYALALACLNACGMVCFTSDAGSAGGPSEQCYQNKHLIIETLEACPVSHRGPGGQDKAADNSAQTAIAMERPERL